MNADVKKLWVDALRSGEYKQAREILGIKTPHMPKTRYCCLGVLCDLAVKSGVQVSTYVDREGIVHFGDRTDLLPDEVVTWAELPGNNPESADLDETLASLNDEKGYSFEKIAKIIEDEL